MLVESGSTPVIIDAGANIGLASLWFAELFPLARIFAVEPDICNQKVLEQNIQGRSNIIAVAGGVWDKSTMLHIENPDAGAASLRTAEGGDLRGYTIPEIIKEANGQLFIVKVDIEGAEAALFRSNTDWFAEASLVVLELHDWLYPGQGTSRNFLRCLSDQPIDLVYRGENMFCFRFR